MSLQISGQIIQILPVQSGVSKAGKEWQKQEFVIETEEQFPKSVCFTLFNDKINILQGYNQGDQVDVGFNLESREFNGRWYHNINAWKIDRVQNEAAAGMMPPEFAPEDVPPPAEDSVNDLPF
ncbi:DUF3127 domain-containing protein [Prolixibacteraceae bacterium JC049]|jgi:hypothetical protein|nr:DUF3127 domain-containing protein [Prolixibacteraceae bacterium JC049]